MVERPLILQDMGFIGLNLVGKEQRKACYQNALKAAAFLTKRTGQILELIDSALLDGQMLWIQEWALRLRQFRKIIILGPGKDLLPAKALCAPLQSWIWIEDSFPRLCFLDPIDPEIFWELMSIGTPNETAVLIFSETGNEEEVLLPLIRCLEYYDGLIPTEKFSNHFFIVRQPVSGPISDIIQRFHLPCLTCGTNFLSNFWPIFIPAIILGFDVKKFFEGLCVTLHQFNTRLLKIPIESTALMSCLIQRGVCIHFLYAYGDFLHPWTQWYQTFWNTLLKDHHSVLTCLDAAHAKETIFQKIGKAPPFCTLVIENQVTYENFKPELWKGLLSLQKFAFSPLGYIHQEMLEKDSQKLQQNQIPFRVLKINLLNENTLGALSANGLLEAWLMKALCD